MGEKFLKQFKIRPFSREELERMNLIADENFTENEFVKILGREVASTFPGEVFHVLTFLDKSDGKTYRLAIFDSLWGVKRDPWWGREYLNAWEVQWTAS